MQFVWNIDQWQGTSGVEVTKYSYEVIEVSEVKTDGRGFIVQNQKRFAQTPNMPWPSHSA